jgi:glycosyltransferase involved in cell wall biosynthesis
MIRSRQPDAVLVMHSPFAYKALPYLRLVADGRPILDFTHIDEHDWYSGGYTRLSLEHSHELDLEITATEYLKRWLVERGADETRIEPCHINIDPAEPEHPSTRADFGLPEGVPIIFYPCRLIDQKQPPVLAKTVLELSRRGQQFLVLIAGDGPFEPWLKAFVRKNGLDRFVRFLGPQPNAQVRQLMPLVDVVFLPSKNEGIAVAFYEAMAAGVAVVGADVGGQRELVTPDCGVLVQRGTEEEEALRYADVLVGLLEAPEQRQRLGEAGRARILAQFTLERMGERMEVLLRRAADLAASDPRPEPSADEAGQSALEAVRLVPWTSWGPALSGKSPLWRFRVMFLWGLVIVGGPLYRLGLRLGFRRMESLRQTLIRLLNPGAR